MATVEWRGGVSPPRSLRTGREPLGSSGSQYPAVPHIEAASARSGYSGEGERSFRWQAERHSGEDEQQSERSDADMVIVE